MVKTLFIFKTITNIHVNQHVDSASLNMPIEFNIDK